jgi:hypothetical protein
MPAGLAPWGLPTYPKNGRSSDVVSARSSDQARYITGANLHVSGAWGI